MNEIQPFNKEPKCPKCLTVWTIMKHFSEEEGEEYIKVTCKVCGYTWNMKTADSDKKELILEEEKEVPESLKMLREEKARQEKE